MRQHAPITSESIADKIDGYSEQIAVRVTLETVIDFFYGNTSWQTKAFGLQSHPVASWNPDTRLYK